MNSEIKKKVYKSVHFSKDCKNNIDDIDTLWYCIYCFKKFFTDKDCYMHENKCYKSINSICIICNQSGHCAEDCFYNKKNIISK